VHAFGANLEKEKATVQVPSPIKGEGLVLPKHTILLQQHCLHQEVEAQLGREKLVRKHREKNRVFSCEVFLVSKFSPCK